MPEDDRALAVWCFGRLAGALTDAKHSLVFGYDETWIDGGMPPLSQSLPLDGSFAPEAAGAFFGGLLPEGMPRELMARRLGVSSGNDFALLAAVGGDTAGAVSLQPPGQDPPHAGDIEWLDDDALTQLIDELPVRPMHADDDGEYRLSLAGAQDKLPVVVDSQGRIGLTKGQTPSTHILKTPIERLDDTVVNEAFCLALGRAMGVDAATATPHRVGEREFLLVERYDRRTDDDDNITRLHQEDFCQALGIPAQRKYQSEGGPSLADCFSLLRAATAVPAREIVKLLDDVALSFLVGNHDAHGKNYSLLYLPENANAVLAPVYDVISTFAYNRKHNLSRKVAMAIGGEYRPDYMRSRHLARTLDETGLGAASARRRLLGHAAVAPRLARGVRDDFNDAGWDAPVLDRIVALIDARAAMLNEISAPPPVARRPIGPLAYHPRDDELDDLPRHLTTDLPRLRVGQQWRDLQPSPGEAAQTLTIERFEDDGMVTASVRHAGTTATSLVMAPATNYKGYALLSDPEWKVHLVAAMIAHDTPETARVIRTGGELQGTRSHSLAPDGLGGPESCFRIVAPTRREAIALVQAIVGDDVTVRAAPRWADET